jgi:hypothetical protein
MNERIRQLAGQALDRVVPYTWTRLDYDEIQRLQEYFAELIVRECISIAQDRAAFDWAPPNDVNHIIDEIKEHFGVEE